MQLKKKKHIEDRIQFCHKMLRNIEDLTKIAFSDESRFVLKNDKRWVWRRRGETVPSSLVCSSKFPNSIMVFAVISMNYKSKLLIVNGSIDADKYIQNIAEVGFIEDLDKMHGPLNWIFQQDGAKCHTAKTALDWIEENCAIIPDWPANSPDLSPIENLWSFLKNYVEKINPKTKEVLINCLQDIWASISL